MTEIIVFSEKQSPRLDYVLSFTSNILGIKILNTTNASEFTSANAAKINYSAQEIPNTLQIEPHGLLFEKGIRKFKFTTLEKDVFAFTFFMLSRYEEYVIEDRDLHNRFEAKSSYLHIISNLDTPLVDILLYDLRDKLIQLYHKLQFNEPTFKSEFTIDIDQVFLYQQKSIKRFVGANLKDFTKFKMRTIFNRKLSYFGLKHDPWNVYKQLKEKFSNTQTQPIFFFLVGRYAKFDKNLNPKNSKFQKTIREVANWANVGIHPSYFSNKNETALAEELNKLENILGKKITRSRQHYIKLNLPQTYRKLLSLGITDDYTMGFADDVGFRAGTSHVFNWYDIENEQETTLRVHPFCAMDVTMKNYLQYKPEHADFVLHNLQSEVKKVNGTFTIVAHNESLSGYGEWDEWDEILLNFC